MTRIVTPETTKPPVKAAPKVYQRWLLTNANEARRVLGVEASGNMVDRSVYFCKTPAQIDMMPPGNGCPCVLHASPPGLASEVDRSTARWRLQGQSEVPSLPSLRDSG